MVLLLWKLLRWLVLFLSLVHVHTHTRKQNEWWNLLLDSCFEQGLAKHATDAMNESRTLDFLANVTFCCFPPCAIS